MSVASRDGKPSSGMRSTSSDGIVQGSSDMMH